jgi:hypothetical protein
LIAQDKTILPRLLRLLKGMIAQVAVLAAPRVQ